jgi:uncharacterized membrane protein HdeD (DUF308 family)
METRTKELLRKNAPWRRGIPWQVVAAEGVIMLSIGLFMLVSPQDAKDIVRQLLAAVLLAHSTIMLVTTFRAPVDEIQRFQILRSAIGVTVGAIVTLAPVSDYLSVSASRLILGAGLVAHALVGLGSMVPRRAEGRRLVGEGVAVALTVIIGITMLVNTGSDASRTVIFGTLVALAGAILAVYAAWLRRSATAMSAVPAAGATS